MQIDWFTWLAQVINFLILVWLLKRFLYGRIVKAMDEREAKIASRLNEAAEKRTQAEQEAERYRTLNQELDEQRQQLLTRASNDAETRRQQLLEEARRGVENLQTQWFEALQQEKMQFLQDFREKMGQQIFAIVRRALKDLANADLQQQMVSHFLDRLAKLEPSERDVMGEAIRASEREVELRSAFPLSAEIRDRITASLREHLEDGVIVRFEVEPTLGCGIELHAHSHRLAWNLASYLEALEGTVFQSLEEKAIEHAKPRDQSTDRDAGAAASRAG